MGEVYLGEKIGPEGFVKPVVLKCVLPQLAKDRAFVNLFLDEARLAALLNHPNIAQVYDFGLVDGVYYIAMEYVPGYTVDDIRRKLRSIGQHMPLQHVACIASQVCQGLHYAHTLTDASGDGLGLVHRDVSPHNLIVSVDGSVKIVDFGIAKARAGLTRVQAKGAVGKFGYMSPEQARGEQVDGRSDMFSLGICLWELSTNERLHDGELERPPEYSPARPVRGIDTVRSEVPRQMSQIIDTALAVEPVDRFPTARDMHLALERFQAAMTHYAGQAALAQYIKDLVEGRVENPERRPGEVVEPAGQRPSGRPGPSSGGLEEARAYEEVFGVALESERPRPKMRAVPKSWETRPKRAPSPVQRQVDGQQRLLDLRESESTGDIPELMEVSTARPAPSSRPSPRPQVRAQAAPRRGPSALSVFLLLLLAALVVGAFWVIEHQEVIVDMLPKPEVTSQVTSIYRIESDPPGARVYLDGERVEGRTPVEVDLIPEVTYEIAVEADGLATKVAEVRAATGSEIRPLPFKLEPSGVLTVRTKPPGATVIVENRVVRDRVTPMTLRDIPANRPVRVTVRVDGLPSQSKKVRLRPGRRRRLTFELGES
jgi:serine/threonine protein kinase